MAGEKGPLRIAIEDFLKTFDTREIFARWGREAAEDIEGALIDTYRDFWEQLSQVEGIPDGLNIHKGDKFVGSHQGGAAAALGFAGQLGSSAATALLAPIMRLINYQIDTVVRSARVDPSVMFPMIWRHLFTEDEGIRLLQDLGWSWDFIQAWSEILKPRPSVGELLAAQYRLGHSNKETRTELFRRGYNGEDIERLESLSKFIPGPGDLVRMQVREAWNSNVIRKWGYDQGDWSQFKETMQRLGDVDGEWANRYWYAHWEIPSVTMGIEMRHRDIIDDDEFDTLLHIHDIAPGWRDPIKKAIYAPYTRVDVRRMHGLGVLSDDDLIRAYMDLGYDLEKATNLAIFTIRYNTDEDRKATKTDILKAYRIGTFTRGEAHKHLESIGYSSDWANYYLAIEDMTAAEELTDETVQAVKTLFINGHISETDVYVRLGKLDLSATRIERYLELWQVQRQARVVLPSKSDLDRFYRTDLISADEYKQELAKRGYEQRYIDWYYNALLDEIAEEAREEAERAAKEAERVAQQERKTAYEEAKAQIDYEIAQARLHLVELKTALERLAKSERRKKLMSEIENLKLQIERIKAEIQEKRTQLAEARDELLKLTIAPEVLQTYQLVDDIKNHIAELNATIADLKAELTAAQGLLELARVGPGVVAARRRISELQVEIANELETIANLKLAIAANRAELMKTWTEEDVEALEEEIRNTEKRIAELIAERARLRLPLYEV